MKSLSHALVIATLGGTTFLQGCGSIEKNLIPPQYAYDMTLNGEDIIFGYRPNIINKLERICVVTTEFNNYSFFNLPSCPHKYEEFKKEVTPNIHPDGLELSPTITYTPSE